MTPACEETERDRCLSLDGFFGAMADSRSRYVLYSLRETADGVASFDDVIAFVLAQDPDLTDEETVATILHHTVLPKLEAAVLIEYDPRSETIRYRANDWFDRCVAHSAWIERQ